ncbi:pyrimidine 5'-nucleotidase [Marinomonas sp. THO17]|uniref:pyrimidine 5'-nucleotidase n=1 Tax=Marinomonas sp. THO17 TaxID=3149048 RepID=UPI00336C00D6
MKYQWVIFDADETLFHFDNFSGLKQMFKQHQVDFDQADFEAYQKINKPLWVAYQNGAITATELQTRRFDEWSKRLGISSHELNQNFLHAMADICKTLPGAKELVRQLHQAGTKMAIMTNGFTQLQSIRLERTDMHHFFDHLIISEQVGHAKPSSIIFDHAFEKMGQPDKQNVLMVGDTLESDILGGNQYGIDTCWLNHNKQTDTIITTDIIPTKSVGSLMELHSWLFKDSLIKSL